MRPQFIHETGAHPKAPPAAFGEEKPQVLLTSFCIAQVVFSDHCVFFFSRVVRSESCLRSNSLIFVMLYLRLLRFQTSAAARGRRMVRDLQM